MIISCLLRVYFMFFSCFSHGYCINFALKQCFQYVICIIYQYPAYWMKPWCLPKLRKCYWCRYVYVICHTYHIPFPFFVDNQDSLPCLVTHRYERFRLSKSFSSYYLSHNSPFYLQNEFCGTKHYPS